MLRKVVAFIGLIGVVYALALQHGLFDRANAASREPAAQTEIPAPAQPKAEAKTVAKKAHPKH